MQPVVIRIENHPQDITVLAKVEPAVGQVVELRYDPNDESPFSKWRDYKVLRRMIRNGTSVQASNVYYVVTPVVGTSEEDPNLLTAPSADQN